jgi:ethanolamine utilization protein EutN
MRIAQVSGTVTATVKDLQLSARKLLIVDFLDTNGAIREASVVVTDVCGAGVGERVLVTTGSAARMAAGLSGIATDATAIAVIDEITLAKPKF